MALLREIRLCFVRYVYFGVGREGGRGREGGGGRLTRGKDMLLGMVGKKRKEGWKEGGRKGGREGRTGRREVKRKRQ